MDMKEIKAAAELALLNAHCFDEEAQAVFRFALAAIPVIAAAEEAVGRIRYGVSREMGSDVVKILDAALAKLKESA